MAQDKVDPENNYEQTKQRVGFVFKREATPETYRKLGFRCGLEIHQQLKTDKKLFCRCPAGIYQESEDFDAEIVRHMRPTLSELGEYDGTALMEFKTRKEITYRIKNPTACTYEIDDTPPFPMNRQALAIALEVALLLKTSVVGEFHITRKQYLDGSIPTGFQRTGILGIEGSIPLGKKTIRIQQLSIEEDACREVSDIGHQRIYLTDRLGMPLIETVTYPDMETPDEAAEAGQYLRFLTRSTGKVRTGMGAARQDVNVSVTGGTRVEIKGVAHIGSIPLLTHTEAFRQKALLNIKEALGRKKVKAGDWRSTHVDISGEGAALAEKMGLDFHGGNSRIVAVNLPGFQGLLSHFTQPGQVFADEISGRLKVIACLDKPNMIHSEAGGFTWDPRMLSRIRKALSSSARDAQLVFWGPEDDIKTALETIDERCLLAFQGVPNETRKALRDGTTIFERVLPGPDRMYPDTDSAPIAVGEEEIARARASLPSDIAHRVEILRGWGVPADTYHYLLKRNLFPLLERIANDFSIDPKFVATLFGHRLKHIEGVTRPSPPVSDGRLYDLFAFVEKEKLQRDVFKQMLPVVVGRPGLEFDAVLAAIEYEKKSEKAILSHLPALKEEFAKIQTSKDGAEARGMWMMGRLRSLALGNIPLKRLRQLVSADGDNGGRDG